MPESLTIPKNPLYPPSMDWTFLRREGIRHIERLGSMLWTDYNLHDPGITILEVLCYALTDLGYRTHLPPKDLFAGSSEEDFFTAAQILPTGPVTALDFRKLVIDIPEVRNAWVEQRNEADVQFVLKQKGFNQIKKALKPYARIWKVGDEEEYANGISDIISELDTLIKEAYEDLTTKKPTTQSCRTEGEKRAIKTKLGCDLMVTLWVKIKGEQNLLKILLLYGIAHHLPPMILGVERIIDENEGATASQAREVLAKIKAIHDLLKRREFDQILLRSPTAPVDANLFQALLALLWQTSGNLVNVLLGEEDENDSCKKALAFPLLIEPLLCLLLEHNFSHRSLSEPLNDPGYNLFVPKGIWQVSLQLEEGSLVNVEDIKELVQNRLHRYRNLGEDFHSEIEIIEHKDLGVSLNVELDPVADEVEVLADIVKTINEHLSPSVHFYSLEQMLNRYGTFYLDEESLERLEEAILPPTLLTALQTLIGEEFVGIRTFAAALESKLSIEDLEEYGSRIFVHAKKIYDTNEIYLGPLLQHGFLDEKELMAAQPRQVIYRSDLFRLVSEVEGVAQVNVLEMFKCNPDGTSIPTDTPGITWCLSFACRCLPRLDIECSSFYVQKADGQIQIETLDIIDYLAAYPSLTTKIDRTGNMDLPVPSGRVHTELAELTSIQEDFPRTYKIGRVGVASKESDLRKAQSKQLQGYLVFYDQILANYLSHLANVRRLLSLKGEDGLSWQALYDLPGIQDLLVGFQQEIASGSSADATWEGFKNDAENSYIQLLKRLMEGNLTKQGLIKNRIFDHLLGRFGEQFTDFVLNLYQIERPVDEDSPLGDSFREWASDKQRFLDHMPLLGSGRAAGFNYRKPAAIPIWRTEELETYTEEELHQQIELVEGLKRRVCAKLGLDDWTRHTITCEPAFVIAIGQVREQQPPQSPRVKYEFFVKPNETSTERLLVSTQRFTRSSSAEAASNDFLNLAADIGNYDISEDSGKVGFWVDIPKGDRRDENALLLEPLVKDEADQRLDFIQKLAGANCQDDSFHIVEHLLLRPRNEAYTQLLEPLVCCPEDLELLDPYSFWISVVVPNWVYRFREKEQFYLFEQTVRKEAPANLAVRICALSREQMLDFEKRYYTWINILCTPEQEDLPKATDELVRTMNDWNPHHS